MRKACMPATVAAAVGGAAAVSSRAFFSVLDSHQQDLLEDAALSAPSELFPSDFSYCSKAHEWLTGTGLSADSTEDIQNDGESVTFEGPYLWMLKNFISLPYGQFTKDQVAEVGSDFAAPGASENARLPYAKKEKDVATSARLESPLLQRAHQILSNRARLGLSSVDLGHGVGAKSGCSKSAQVRDGNDMAGPTAEETETGSALAAANPPSDDKSMNDVSVAGAGSLALTRQARKPTISDDGRAAKPNEQCNDASAAGKEAAAVSSLVTGSVESVAMSCPILGAGSVSSARAAPSLAGITPNATGVSEVLSTSKLYDYVKLLIATYRRAVAGQASSPPVLRRIAELLQADRLPKLLMKSPKLSTLLWNADKESRTANARRTKRAEREIRRRRQLLDKIVHSSKGEARLFDRFVNLSDSVRKRAEYELRLLRLRQFQAVVRQEVLAEGRRTCQPIQDFLLSQSSFSTSNKHSARSREQYEGQSNVCDTTAAAAVLRPSDSDGQPTSGRMSLAVTRMLEKARNRSQAPPGEQLARLRMERVLQRLAPHYRRTVGGWRKRRGAYGQVASDCLKVIEAIHVRQETLREKERKERLKLLKEKDFDKYLELVRETKNARIQELLAQTDRFLASLSRKVEAQQKRTEAAIKRQQSITDKETLLGSQREGTEAVDGKSSSEAMDCAQKVTDPNAEPAGCSGSEEVREAFLAVTQKVSEVAKQPSILSGGTLMGYQLSGLQFLINLYNNNLSGILADEMGLGKTIQTIALLAYLKENKGNNGPHLVIVPLSTLPNWLAEFEKWCPSLRVLQFRGNRQERQTLRHTIRRTETYDVCITTYDWILRERNLMLTPFWAFVVVDEGHRMKNVKSKFHITLSDFRSTHRLLLTGTPLQNNLTELWALLNFLLPSIFSSAIDFRLWFHEPFRDLPSNESAQELTEEEQLLVINRLHSVLRPFLLRRVKADVLEDLPDKREYIIRVELSKWQKLVYERLSNKALRLQAADGRVSNRSVSNIMMQLRKVVNHPFLFEDEYYVNDDLWRVSGKFEVLDRMVPKLLQFGHRILMFCQMTQLMDLLDDYFEYKGIKRCRLDGSTALEDRRERMARFNDPDSDTFVFTLSTRAGGLGLNLQAADTVILFDSDWNPHQDLQAQARAHRLGQKNEVRVFRLVTVSGIEEAILSKAQQKLDIDEKIIQAGMFNNRFTDEERQGRLKELIGSKNVNRETRVTSPQELNRFLARSQEEEETFNHFDESLLGPDVMVAFEVAAGNERHLSQRVDATGNGGSSVGQQADSLLTSKEHSCNSATALDATSSTSPVRGLTATIAARPSIDEDDLPLAATLGKPPRIGRGNVNTTMAAADATDASSLTGESIGFDYAASDDRGNDAIAGVGSPSSSSPRLHHRLSELTPENLLIHSGRLMAEDEIPERWLIGVITVEDDDETGEKEAGGTPSELLRSTRRARVQASQRVNAGTLSDAAFSRALQNFESGRVADFETAIRIEGEKAEGKRVRPLKTVRRTRKGPSTDSSSEKNNTTVDVHERANSAKGPVEPSSKSRKTGNTWADKDTKNLRRNGPDGAEHQESKGTEVMLLPSEGDLSVPREHLTDSPLGKREGPGGSSAATRNFIRDVVKKAKHRLEDHTKFQQPMLLTSPKVKVLETSAVERNRTSKPQSPSHEELRVSDAAAYSDSSPNALSLTPPSEERKGRVKRRRLDQAETGIAANLSNSSGFPASNAVATPRATPEDFGKVSAEASAAAITAEPTPCGNRRNTAPTRPSMLSRVELLKAKAKSGGKIALEPTGSHRSATFAVTARKDTKLEHGQQLQVPVGQEGCLEYAVASKPSVRMRRIGSLTVVSGQHDDGRCHDAQSSSFTNAEMLSNTEKLLDAVKCDSRSSRSRSSSSCVSSGCDPGSLNSGCDPGSLKSQSPAAFGLFLRIEKSSSAATAAEGCAPENELTRRESDIDNVTSAGVTSEDPATLL